jgi:hypothetical protein
MPINDVLIRFPQLRKFHSGKPATERDIADIESALSLHLPADYATFVRHFGFVRWAGNAICGFVHPDVPRMPGYEYSVVTQTAEARAEVIDAGYGKLPSDGMVISRYDAGGWYVLFAEESKRPGAVALFDHEARGGEVESWPSLEAFLVYLGV